jgi:hypothetical protein
MLYGIMYSAKLVEKTMPKWKYVNTIHVAISSRLLAHSRGFYIYTK